MVVIAIDERLFDAESECGVHSIVAQKRLAVHFCSTELACAMEVSPVVALYACVVDGLCR